MANPSKSTAQSYSAAKARYSEMGVNTEAAMAALAKIPISLHCWQGDDVGGFENTGEGLSGGIAVTGNYPGKARTPDELRADLDEALSLAARQNHDLAIARADASIAGADATGSLAMSLALPALCYAVIVGFGFFAQRPVAPLEG